jgi:hypothetical protein
VGVLNLIHQAALSVVRDGVGGHWLEAGVWRGGTSILLRAIARAYGVTDRAVILADSFQVCVCVCVCVSGGGASHLAGQSVSTMSTRPWSASTTYAVFTTFPSVCHVPSVCTPLTSACYHRPSVFPMRVRPSTPASYHTASSCLWVV